MRLDRVPGVRQLPALLRPPRRDTVLFDSWWGAYSDNPRAISELLHERHPDLRQGWVAEDAARASLPEWATAVRPGTRPYLAALGQARWVVASTHLPDYFRKRRDTVYVQTWHGTPLKRIGFEIPDVATRGDGYVGRLRNDVAKWDVLVSPNAFSTPILRRAFRYEGSIVETGYPRNDFLASPRAGAVREAVRAALGLDAATRAILYAPTLRDGAPFELRLDIAALRDGLGGDHVVLLRAHPAVVATMSEADRRDAVDVSRHGDIRDLYLAADVLVTDYSSAMFDFAVTRKPIVFFTYDLARYRDAMRGFYFDFEQDAPGPLIATTEDLVEALRDMEGVRQRFAPAYERFVARFCHLDDGRAGERVIEAVFGEGPDGTSRPGS